MAAVGVEAEAVQPHLLHSLAVQAARWELGRILPRRVVEVRLTLLVQLAHLAMACLVVEAVLAVVQV